MSIAPSDGLHALPSSLHSSALHIPIRQRSHPPDIPDAPDDFSSKIQ
jgi:hypothetical protein